MTSDDPASPRMVPAERDLWREVNAVLVGVACEQLNRAEVFRRPIEDRVAGMTRFVEAVETHDNPTVNDVTVHLSNRLHGIIRTLCIAEGGPEQAVILRLLNDAAEHRIQQISDEERPV